MVKPEWGVKRICPNCGTRYYDFRKSPPVCPACGTVYDPEALLKSRRIRPAADEPRKTAKKAAVVEDIEDIVPDVDDPDADVEVPDDDTLIEADDDEDDNDLADEVVVEDNDDER